MAKYVVIGSNAFSGQDFVDLLLDDPSREVIGISRSEEKPDFMLRYKARPDLSGFRFKRFDTNKEIEPMLAFLDAEKPDYIVNFAAQSEVGPSYEQRSTGSRPTRWDLAKFVNHMRQKNLPEAAICTLMSSPEAYGNCTGTVTETTPDNPSTPYAASKAAADMINAVYQKTFGWPAMNVRATNVYGARQQLFKIMCRLRDLSELNKKIKLDGGGVAVKSYIQVRDVSRGELAMLEKGRVGERYHLSPDDGIAVQNVVRLICERMGQQLLR